MKWAEARDAAKRPTMHRTPPQTELSSPNVQSGEVEKPCYRPIQGKEIQGNVLVAGLTNEFL